MPEVNILEGFRPRSWLIGGESGHGKTHFILDIGNYLIEKMTAAGIPKERWTENCSIGFIACEDGAAPLVRRGVLPPELRPAFRYMQCSRWTDVKVDTKSLVDWLLGRAKAGVPLENTWLLVDNAHNLWTWLQDEFAVEIYGMTMKNLAKLKRMQAQREGKSNLPTFNRMIDYAVMNPEYYEWYNSFHPTGAFPLVNYAITCPVWLHRERSDPNDKTSPLVVTDVDPKCQPDTIFRCDEFMWIQHGEDGVFRLNLIKTRCGTSFKGLPEPSAGKMARFYAKHENP